MEIKILYWYWLIFGALLGLVGIVLPNFILLWCGLSGILVAVLLWFSPAMTPSEQLFIWVVASAIFSFLWFMIFKPMITGKAKVNAASQTMSGESGLVVRVPQGLERGIVRFNSPLLGSVEWPFICDQQVNSGDRVYVREVSGNSVIVEKRIQQDAEQE